MKDKKKIILFTVIILLMLLITIIVTNIIYNLNEEKFNTDITYSYSCCDYPEGVYISGPCKCDNFKLYVNFIDKTLIVLGIKEI